METFILDFAAEYGIYIKNVKEYIQKLVSSEKESYHMLYIIEDLVS
jgi:hypothetical protein